jgi:hypothetical protein
MSDNGGQLDQGMLEQMRKIMARDNLVAAKLTTNEVRAMLREINAAKEIRKIE